MQPTVELLVMARDARTVASLCDALRGHGLVADTAQSAQAAQKLFLNRGGHRLLVLGPDVSQGLARDVVACLRSVDPELPVVAFGSSAFREDSSQWLTRLPDYHPSSRAGVGAVLRVVRNLKSPS